MIRLKKIPPDQDQQLLDEGTESQVTTQVTS